MRSHHRLHCTITCDRCKQPIAGWIAFDEKWQLVDSEGFMVYEPLPVCDDCVTKDSGMHPNTMLVPDGAGSFHIEWDKRVR